MTFYSFQSALYYLEPGTMLLRKAQVGAIKQSGDRTYQLNQNYRWERVNQNIGRTVRKLERQRNVDKLRWIGDRIDNAGALGVDADIPRASANRIEESKFAIESLSRQDIRNPKKMRALLQAELSQPKPKIGSLRRIAKLATEGASTMEPINDRLGVALAAIAEDAKTEAELRQDAQELKRDKGRRYEIVDGQLRQQIRSDFRDFTLEKVQVFPPGGGRNPELMKRYQTESDPWLKQAILHQSMSAPVIGALKRENDGSGNKFYRYDELPNGKFSASGSPYAYQQISESELSPKERQLLSGQ